MPKRTINRSKKQLVLLDAHAIIHRAYHALPDFTSPTGEPTGALYGLSSMLLRIVADLEPDYIAACYDLPKPTIRHEVYADYKGTRAKTDELLIAQLKRSRDVFKAFQIPMYDREGFEADDILGTVAELMKNEEGLEVIIASGDMDTMQLAEGDRVKVYTLKKGINDTILYDAKAIEERYGFPANLIADYKGLRGDPSDNIKGVPGIGEKTATELIKNFGTIEDMYKTLAKSDKKFIEVGIKPRIVELLKTHEEDARFSKHLATIRTDAPIAFSLEDSQWKDGKQLPTILNLFDELGFRSLRARAKSVLGHEGDDADEEIEDEIDEESVDPIRLDEAKVMLWLVASDFTNPSLEDVLAFTKKTKFDDAYVELERLIKETGKLSFVYDSIEKPLVPILREMETHGVLIDKKALAELAKKYHAELSIIEKRIHKHAGKEFNVGSPKQLAEVLFDDLELVAKGQKKTSTGQRSTRESELEKIRDLHPIVEDILEYREIQKLLGTYIDAIPPLMDKEGRIHPHFIQTGAVTGRMATTNPSVQNIPIRSDRGKAIRNAFVAPKGSVLIALDYSQIELRLAAILSGDEKLCDIFRSGRDVHKEVAAAVFKVEPDKVDYEMRRRAKIINFGILYGMGVNSLRASLGSSTAEAHKFYDDYFGTFTTLSAYLESTKGFARKHGYTETIFGRRRQFPEMKSSLPYVRAQAERMAINAPLQGTQSDIIKLAMVRIEEMLRKEGVREKVHLLLQVHDELVFEVEESIVGSIAPKIKEVMESILPLEEAHNVPVIAEGKTGKNWGQLDALQDQTKLV
ncbi:MAG: DNA polymerase I [Parcubacteria bacterium C7867-001]|nr:MAG: DNA polymerase I [Parcubacteria bacterium C7867-001]